MSERLLQIETAMGLIREGMDLFQRGITHNGRSALRNALANLEIARCEETDIVFQSFLRSTHPSLIGQTVEQVDSLIREQFYGWREKS